MIDDERFEDAGEDADGRDGLGDSGSRPADRLGKEELEAEESGLGLTEEFARIEAEIQGEADFEPAPASKPAEPTEAEDPPAGPVAGEGLEDLDREPDGSDDENEDFEDEDEDFDETEDFDEDANLDDDFDETEDDGAADDEVADEAVEDDRASVVATAPTRIRPAAGGPPLRPLPPRPVPLDEGEIEIRQPSLWLRFMAGSVVIVASCAAAVVVWGMNVFETFAAQLDPIPNVANQLASVEPGEPQTIMIVGSDKRTGGGMEDDDPGRSDTTMLLRVDPDERVLSLFSLPRDLKVFIPGHGEDKLNEAYTIGGVRKTLQTVKNFTGIPINHVVEINFQGFADAVNAIECVYIDVDRRYFNDNSTAMPGEEYMEIDINAGYQRLCGLKALQYVRYRHTDTDLVRAARQQDFLREARQKVSPRRLLPGLNGSNELIDIFTDYTESDIATADQIIGVLKSFISVRDVPVNEVHFQGDIGDATTPFVTATDKQVRRAMDEFLNGVSTGGQRGGAKANRKRSGGGGGGGGGGAAKEKKKTTAEVPAADVVATEDLSDPKFGTLATRFDRDSAKNKRRLDIPVFYPTALVPGSSYSLDSRTYKYRNEQDRYEHGFKTVIVRTTPETLPEYYGVTGTTWDDPPILRNPSEVREIDGRDYMLFYDGGRLRLVGWQQDGNSYWLSNTLTQSIGEAEMLAMAASMREA